MHTVYSYITIMCYEFVHACQDPLTVEIAALVQPDKYFLICIGDINYLYSNDTAAVTGIRNILKREKIKIYTLTVDEMISVIDFPGMDNHQTFHGSSSLLNRLREITGMLAPGRNGL